MGTLTADGTEQTVFESLEVGEFTGYIDLTNVQAGDEVKVQVYVKIKSTGDYRKWEGYTFIDAQLKPALRIPPLQCSYGYKTTLQQTKGTYRTFDYVFFKR